MKGKNHGSSRESNRDDIPVRTIRVREQLLHFLPVPGFQIGSRRAADFQTELLVLLPHPVIETISLSRNRVQSQAGIMPDDPTGDSQGGPFREWVVLNG